MKKPLLDSNPQNISKLSDFKSFFEQCRRICEAYNIWFPKVPEADIGNVNAVALYFVTYVFLRRKKINGVRINYRRMKISNFVTFSNMYKKLFNCTV